MVKASAAFTNHACILLAADARGEREIPDLPQQYFKDKGKKAGGLWAQAVLLKNLVLWYFCTEMAVYWNCLICHWRCYSTPKER